MVELASISFLIGITLVFIGFLFLLFYIFLRRSREIKATGESKTEGGVFVLIGPIPIVVSSSKRLGYILLIVGITLVLSVILLTWLISFYL